MNAAYEVLATRVYVGVFVRVGAYDARVPIFTVIHPNTVGRYTY